MTTLPAPHHPAEVVALDPESLEVANLYLSTGSIEKVTEDLAVTRELVAQILDRPLVKSYINQVFFDLGFNNRFKMRRAMDVLISKKFQELEESGVGTSKDITELLALSHKMTMEQLDREIALEKLRSRGTNSPRNQVNVQINDHGSNYGNLLEKILNVKSQ